MARKRHFLKPVWAALLSAALLAAPVTAAAAEPSGETEAWGPVLAIYTTGDMAGRVYRQDPLTGERVAAGYQNVASAMEQEREQVDAALLLDSGDAVDNSLLQDGGEAEALALRAIGYDVLVPGLNEFRLGPDARDGFFDALTAEEEETAPVRVLSGNYLDGDSQEPAAEGYAVLTAEVGGRAVRVGVLGLGAIDGAERLPASYCEGVDFAHGDNTENSYVWEWTEYWQEKLEGENCDLVVVVCHADRDVAADFAAQTTGIDLVVGGHGSAYADTVQNAAGENVSLVSGGGTDLTRTTVTLSAAGTPEVGESTLLSLEDYAPDDTLAGQVADELEKAEKQAGERVAALTGDWIGETEPQYGPTPTATLAAASMLWATGADGALLCPRSLGETDAAALFQEGANTAVLSLDGCAALLSDPTPLAAVELTGAQLKAWLDICAESYTAEEDGSISGGEAADTLYGLDYTLYLGAPAGERVDGLTLDGEPVEDDQVLVLAVSARRLDDPDFPKGKVVWRSDLDERFAAQGGTPAAVLAACASELNRLVPMQLGSWAVYAGSVGGPLNRLEFITMLYELAGSPQPGASAAFIDVGDSSAAVWAAETGVVSGDGKGRLLPTQAVTREQAAVMLYNYARSLELSAPQDGPAAAELSDAADVAAWARPAVEFCLRTGTLTADGSGRFLPGDTITREEAAEALEAFALYVEANQAR